METEDEMAEMLELRRRTWHGFTRLIGYSTVAIIITLVLMAIFLL